MIAKLKSKNLRGILVAGLVFYFVITPHVSWAQTTDYIFTEIHPPGWIGSRATHITDSGMVLGYGSDGDGNSKGFLYSAGTYTEIIPSILTPPPPPGIDEWEFSVFIFEDINNSGAVVGSVYGGAPPPDDPMGDYFYYSKNFLYSAGTYTELMSGGGRINDSGVILGEAVTMLPPPTAPYSTFSACDINNNGDIAGIGYLLSGQRSVGIYNISTGTYTFSEPLPSGAGIEISVKEISDNGVVVGTMRDWSSYPEQPYETGFLYSEGIFTELIPPGMDASGFSAINSNGTTAVGVGYADWSDEFMFEGFTTTKGILYSGGTYTELIPPGKSGAVIYDINNSGNMVGYAWASPERGFMVSVAPEPISSILFITGGAILAGRQSLKKRKRV
ncbi:MAG: hypothetical protein AABZ36_08065 [Nitrospirota bacterium]